MQSKKGAIELSMTTIIVIVMGVTLLILGLAFVRGIFERLGGISDQTFIKAEDLLGGVENVNELLTVIPSNIEVEVEKDDATKVIIANLGEETIEVKAKASSSDKKLACLFIDEDTEKGKSESKKYKINSGSQKQLVLIIKEKGGSLRTTGCNVEILGAPEGEDNSSTVIVRIKK